MNIVERTWTELREIVIGGIRWEDKINIVRHLYTLTAELETDEWCGEGMEGTARDIERWEDKINIVRH